MPAPRTYLLLADRPVFTVEEAAEVTGLQGARLTHELAQRARDGYFRQVRRGVYATVPLSHKENPDAAPPVNPYLVASKLARPYFLGYHTALELHGVAHSTYHVLHVATPHQMRPFAFQGLAYRRVPASKREVELASTTHRVEDQPVKVAGKEWALVQCALRLGLAGGFEEYVRSVSAFASVDPERVLAATRFYKTRTLYNRVGLVLWANRKRWHLTQGDLAPFKRGLSKHPYYFGAKKGAASYLREWNVFVPESTVEALGLAAQ
jgi:predicted transcriptional regulator of viral defense system